MENITIGQIVAAIGAISIIGAFIGKLVKGYKKAIPDRFEKIEKRLDYVEQKREEYEREVKNSKKEREILLRGELAALKGLKEMCHIDAVSNSINEIEEYMMEETHRYK